MKDTSINQAKCGEGILNRYLVQWPTILDKTLGKNSSLSIIWHALTKYIGPSPLSPILPHVDNVMQNTVPAFGRFLKQHWNGGRGKSRKNLVFITQANQSVTFSQRVLSKIVNIPK